MYLYPDFIQSIMTNGLLFLYLDYRFYLTQLSSIPSTSDVDHPCGLNRQELYYLVFFVGAGSRAVACASDSCLGRPLVFWPHIDLMSRNYCLDLNE